MGFADKRMTPETEHTEHTAHTTARLPAPPRHIAHGEIARARTEALHARRERAARVRAARRKGRRRLALLGTGSLVIVLVLVVMARAFGSDSLRSAPLSRTAHRLPLVFPVLQSTLAASMRFPGTPVALPLPRSGEGAVAVSGVGLVGYTANERSVPIASVTKIMTAYLVLKDHPLVGNSGGPVFVMTERNEDAWVEASEAGDSNIEVHKGERLDERQLLQALMIASADNIANYLASWDAGSVPAFVAKMNAMAQTLGLVGTHYADPSGLNPRSRSTAVDMATLASIAMQNPALRSIVDEQSIRLPLTGEIWNVYNPAIGVDGIIGVKSGFTNAAQVNLVTAAWRLVGGRRVLVVSAAIDQPLSMYEAAGEDEAMLTAATRELRTATLVARQAEVGEAVAAWDHSVTPVSVAAPAVVVGWPGLTLSPTVVAAGPSELTSRHGWPVGSSVGTFEILSPFGTEVTEPALLQSSIRPPPAGWEPSGLVH
jgi:D-alanyl-D-alanine carboxypeptidase (penicillin-binding protein 5/6)